MDRRREGDPREGAEIEGAPGGLGTSQERLLIPLQSLRRMLLYTITLGFHWLLLFEAVSRQDVNVILSCIHSESKF